MSLEDYYDEDHWKRFARMHLDESWSGDVWEPGLADEFSAYTPDQQETLAVAISRLGLDTARIWIDCRVEALDLVTPRECLGEEALLKRVRVSLTRIP